MSNNKEEQKIDLAKLQKALSILQKNNTTNKDEQKTEANPRKSFKERVKLLIQYIVHLINRLVHYIDRIINFISKSEDADRSSILQHARSPIIFGTSVALIFVFLGGIWATTAPLDSAAHATGSVMSISNKQIVQYSGNRGIIKNIMVKQGDLVNANEIIMEFDETHAKQNYNSFLNYYLQLLSLESRLIAERDKYEKVTFDPIMFQFHTSESIKMMEVQINTFNSRKETNTKIVTGLGTEIQKLNQKIISVEESKKSAMKNLELFKSRVISFKDLVKKGYISKNQLDDLEIKESEAASHLARLDAEIASAEQDITKNEIQISRQADEFMTSVLQELKQTQTDLNKVRESFLQSKDELERCTLRSPINGIVNEIYFHTIGAVVTHATTVAEITPIKDKLVIDTKIDINHIGSVVVGQKAKLKFLAFKSRTSPSFIGTVVSLSPDTVVDQQAQQQRSKAFNRPSGDRFYAAIIELDMENFEKIAKPMNLKLVPGMMADINIVTGTRTLFRYLIDPIADQAFRAFNEK